MRPYLATDLRHGTIERRCGFTIGIRRQLAVEQGEGRTLIAVTTARRDNDTGWILTVWDDRTSVDLEYSRIRIVDNAVGVPVFSVGRGEREHVLGRGTWKEMIDAIARLRAGDIPPSMSLAAAISMEQVDFVAMVRCADDVLDELEREKAGR